MAKIVEFERIGGPEQLRLVDREVPAPGPGEVQVDIKAAGLNRAELLHLAGQYLMDPVLPSKIGMEGAGVVRAVGAGVDGVAVGDEVAVTPNMSPDRYGVVGETANVPAAALQPKSAGASFVDTAAFWMAYPTAYGGLVQAGGLRQGAGQSVVIPAASSSVGIAAIQVAKAHGATAIATTRTRAKADRIRALGADHVIATAEEDLEARVREITGGKGFDIAFDPVAGPFVETLAAAAAREARIVLYGLLSGAATPLPLLTMLTKGLTVRTFHVGFDLFAYPDRLAAARDHLLPGLDSGAYTPVIDSTFPLDEAAKAYERLASNRQLGKVVIAVP